MTKMSKFLIMGAAGMALMISACNKDNSVNDLSLNNKLAAVEACEEVIDSVSSTAAASPYYMYNNWNPIPYTLTDGSGTGPTVQFEGIYNSFVRVNSTDWYVGIAPESYCSCETDWEDFISYINTNNTVKNASGNPGTYLSPSSLNYNVVGYNGTYPGLGWDFGLGYYGYTTPTPNSIRCIAIWRDTTAGGTSTSLSDPFDADAAWAMHVVAGGSGGVSDVQFRYYRIK